jgi:hypothetical protein
MIEKKFPLLVHTSQTGDGHEFQTLFHWHCEDLGICHRCIKKVSPYLNGMADRSHLTDLPGFYQLPEHTDGVDIQKS